MATGEDGTSRLLRALYGTDRGQTRAMLGGSDARMLHDAANEIATLRARLARIEPVYEAAMATPSWRLHDRLADEVERARRDAGVCPDCGKAGCGEALYAREAEGKGE